MRGTRYAAWHRAIIATAVLGAVLLGPVLDARADSGEVAPATTSTRQAGTTQALPGVPMLQVPGRDLNQFMSMVIEQVGNYWYWNFVSARVPFRQPHAIAPVRPARTMCGPTANDPFYCALDEQLVLPPVFFTRFVGWPDNDAGVVIVIAHEWGHHVQNLLGITGTAMSIQTELQADCFSGTFLTYADQQGWLDPGDLQEVVNQTITAGDPAGTPWFDPRAHGTAVQRLRAIDEGMELGVSQCLSYTQ